MVMNVGALKSGDHETVRQDIHGVAEAAHRAGAILKVILETVLLDDNQKAEACTLAKLAGADFVKTSTGFASGGGIPTVKVNRLLLRNVSVVGVGLREFLTKVPGADVEIGVGLGKLVDAGLRPPPPVRYPLSEGRAALESLAGGGVLGKVVLEP